jgi:hypothetical protein
MPYPLIGVLAGLLTASLVAGCSSPPVRGTDAASGPGSGPSEANALAIAERLAHTLLGWHDRDPVLSGLRGVEVARTSDRVLLEHSFGVTGSQPRPDCKGHIKCPDVPTFGASGGIVLELFAWVDDDLEEGRVAYQEVDLGPVRLEVKLIASDAALEDRLRREIDELLRAAVDEASAR